MAETEYGVKEGVTETGMAETVLMTGMADHLLANINQVGYICYSKGSISLTFYVEPDILYGYGSVSLP